MINAITFLIGWLLDLIFGDPARLPHPIVWFGKMISAYEHSLNKGNHRKLKGALMAIGLILFVFAIAWMLRKVLGIFALFFFDGAHEQVYQIPVLLYLFDILAIFYCLAGTTLIREVRAVFLALDRSLEEGRQQVARIVGRDTSELSAQEVRKAALETLAENLSDGVIAPLFWFAILGTPGMLAYKMVNTLDSMIGYKTERYRDFGCWAAHIDDIANYIPARLTALLMVIANIFIPLLSRKATGRRALLGNGGADRRGGLILLRFIHKYGRCHASPNSGYPEAALAGILDCRFGGPHYYFGQLFDKPYIGENDRSLTTADMNTAVRVNRIAEILMVILTFAYLCTLK
jgi:adenosylcobinamide-phosphate synthase